MPDVRFSTASESRPAYAVIRPGARYDPAVAEERWRRILEIFDRHIQRAPAGREER
jgi:hypothetical protein